MEGNAKLNFTVQDKAYFNSDTYINIESSDVKEILTEVIHTILEKISIYQKNGSGWYFKEIVHFEIHTADFNPMRGSSYIPLPDWISQKKAIVNIRNKDEKCFLWCVLRYLHPRDKNDFRLKDLEKYEKCLNTKGIKYPVKIQDISKFEKLNPDLNPEYGYPFHEFLQKYGSSRAKTKQAVYTHILVTKSVKISAGRALLFAKAINEQTPNFSFCIFHRS